MDFLQKAGIVLSLRHRNWFFCDKPRRTSDFVKELINQEVQSRPNLEANTCLLREYEGKCLTPEQQRNEPGALLNLYGTVLEPVGDPTPFIERPINPEDNHLVSMPPKSSIYRNTGTLSSSPPFSQFTSAKVTMQEMVHPRHYHLLVQVCLVAAVAEWYRYRSVACFVTGSSPVPLKIRRVGQRCTLNLSRAETSSRWCGVVVRRGVPAKVSSTSLDHGSKLRGPSPKALV
ncbi:uncharacterized protein TNCV_2907491 [Trichonephila clavipes]|nr:uncharacterized protein TNCV_2907491 [Trichonephila clavipes]